MWRSLKPLHVTSSLKTNFIFAILSIHTLQTIKYHCHTFSLFNSKFKFQKISNSSFPPTFSLIPTNITFKFQLTFLSSCFQISFLFFLTVNILFLSTLRITHPPFFSLPLAEIFFFLHNSFIQFTLSFFFSF